MTNKPVNLISTYKRRKEAYLRAYREKQHDGLHRLRNGPQRVIIQTQDVHPLPLLGAQRGGVLVQNLESGRSRK